MIYNADHPNRPKRQYMRYRLTPKLAKKFNVPLDRREPCETNDEEAAARLLRKRKRQIAAGTWKPRLPNAWRHELLALASKNGWTFPVGVPERVFDRVTVRCHKHMHDAKAGDPAIHPHGYFEWTATCQGVRKSGQCQACRNHLSITLERVQWKLARDAKSQLVLPAIVRNGRARATLVCLTCGHKHQTQAAAIMGGSYGCIPCHGHRTSKRQRIDPQIVLARCQALGYRQVGLNYDDGPLRVSFKCRYGRKHPLVAWGHIQQGRGCGCKTRVSSYEHLVRQLVEYITGLEWPKINRVQLRKLVVVHDSKPVPFEFDLFCESLRVAIEVDGAQHQTGTFFGRATDILLRDKVKNAWCKAQNIALIRLPHDWLDALKAATDQERLQMVRAELRAHGLSCRRSPGPLKLKQNTGWAEAGLKRLKALAKKHRFKLLSREYRGTHLPHKFHCRKHGVFERSIHLFNHGCPACGDAIGVRKRAAGRTTRSRQRFINLCGSNYSLVGEFVKAKNQVKVECHRHGEVFDARPYGCFVKNYIVGCPGCTFERNSAAARRRLKQAA